MTMNRILRTGRVLLLGLLALPLLATAADEAGVPEAVRQLQKGSPEADLQFEAAPGEALKELVQLLKPLDTLSAEFTQRVFSQNGNAMQSVEGSFKARRPGHFYWKTDPPSAQTLVTDGDFIWLYDPDLEQVTVQRMSGEIQTTPALLFSGEVAAIDEHYTVSLVVTGDKDPDEFRMFELKPKAKESLFETLRISFLEGRPVALLIQDGLGQFTVLELRSVKVNPAIEGSVFKFEVPDGVDVIKDF
ncbi:MAG: outer membrane lipoprotein carrier protein LolA [unclassified Hahellaceae]|nr:outer membrane lipoprotein carrier protein LolA [Hahellaceae bacterium]